ncbi:glycerol-3-phosphate dehydrogenase [Frateuria aurantia]
MFEDVDLLVVGGGINGVGIARDAVGRGLRVLVCEQDDLAAHTSSASTKLIHGGLRYLEQYEFKLVGKALAEREVLLQAAPHIISPLRFVLPHQPHLRPAWMIRIGLFLYDHLGRVKHPTLKPSRGLDLRTDITGRPLRDEFVRGFVYSDARVQDARLVVLNAMDIRERGGEVLTRTRCIAAQRGSSSWTVQLQPRDGGPVREVRAKALVNAAGPWAARFLDDIAHVAHDHTVRLVKGSHIVVPRLFEHDHAYIFQQPDRRIVFAIPYEREFTLIGTTDVEYQADPSQVEISEDETRYLCEAVSSYFKKPVRPQDVVWAYSGVRPLLSDDSDSASEATRDYLLGLDTQAAPLLNVFGGKLTTFRRLGEDAVDQLAPVLGCKQGTWTAGAVLPGGDVAEGRIEGLVSQLAVTFPWLPQDLLERWCHSYGTRTRRLLGGAKSMTDLGEHFGAGLYAREVDYLQAHEWACAAEDVLWRRSKLGLHFDPAMRERLAAYMSPATP